MRILIIGSDFKNYNQSIAYAFQELGHHPILSSFKNPLYLYDSFLWRILYKSINKFFNGYFYTFDDNYSLPGTIKTIEGVGYYPQAERNFLIGINTRF